MEIWEVCRKMKVEGEVIGRKSGYLKDCSKGCFGRACYDAIYPSVKGIISGVRGVVNSLWESYYSSIYPYSPYLDSLSFLNNHILFIISVLRPYFSNFQRGDGIWWGGIRSRKLKSVESSIFATSKQIINSLLFNYDDLSLLEERGISEESYKRQEKVNRLIELIRSRGRVMSPSISIAKLHIAISLFRSASSHFHILERKLIPHSFYSMSAKEQERNEGEEACKQETAKMSGELRAAATEFIEKVNTLISIFCELLQLDNNLSSITSNSHNSLKKIQSKSDDGLDESSTNSCVGMNHEELTVWEEVLQSEKEASSFVIYYNKTERDACGEKVIKKGIKAATLNVLVVHLTDESSHDLDFLKTFIFTFQSFAHPYQLFEKLLQRYNVPLSTKGDRSVVEWNQQVVMPIQIRVVNMLTMWIRTRFQDFDYYLLKKVNHFIENQLAKDGHQKWAKQLGKLVRRNLRERLAEKESAAMIPKIILLPEIPTPASSEGSKEFLLNTKEDIISQHLCMIEMEMFRKIEPVELLNQSWNKKKYQHRSPNVLNLIRRFNQVSMWCATAILSEVRLARRAKVMEKFILIALKLFSYNNFNTSLAIISALNNAAIHRLKFTMMEIPSKIRTEYEKMCNIMQHNKNNDVYRDLLHSVAPPVLPYLGMYLTDLTFVEDGNADKIGNLINFKKRELIYNIIMEIQQYQLTPYSFPVSPLISKEMWEAGVFSECHPDYLWGLSLKREPKGIVKPNELL
eukprot:CAMPEP_0174275426 /NCGR_PEP_ID=MMETSP0439-20130205/59818_1 /TAXON_ID=0 /ORGANISM="Stereomyxa ramosa, Strain Chinc5" /LENGTH=743 /DNA_ID=CAMNT_0015367527 /DNA_START=239 /DNA_END=2470 /DNA_ORIENTATION=-